MSSILDLKTRLQSKIQSDQAEAEKLTKSALQQHASNLNELLSEELNSIKSATGGHRIALKRLTQEIQEMIQEIQASQAKAQKKMLIVSAAPLLVSLILVGLAFLPDRQMKTMNETHKIQKMSDGKTYKLMIDKPPKTCTYKGESVMCWEIK